MRYLLVLAALVLVACGSPTTAPSATIATAPPLTPVDAVPVPPAPASAVLDLTCKTRLADVIARIAQEHVADTLSIGYRWRLQHSQREVWVIGPGVSPGCHCDIYDVPPNWCTLPAPFTPGPAQGGS